MSAPRCPKCGKPPSRYIERQQGFCSIFLAQSDGSPEHEGTNHDGLPDGVVAECGLCEHRWTLRGMLHIDQVRERFPVAPTPSSKEGGAHE